MFLSLTRSAHRPVRQGVVQRNADGKLVIDNPAKAESFYEEDIVFRGVPVGMMTYGHARLPEKTLKAIKSIGRFCSIADDVRVVGMHHPTKWVSTNPFLYRTDRNIVAADVSLPKETRGKNRAVEIGHDVWIGEDVRLLRPVKLGHGCIIAAGSVVTKDIPPYAIAAGVPARILKYRIDERLIPAMLAIAWWDWPLPTIRDRLPAFYKPMDFVQRYCPSDLSASIAGLVNPPRVYVSPKMQPGKRYRLPNFLILGGMKCGTSSIGQNLHSHPHIHMARGGHEVHYFDRACNFNQGIDWYRAHFPEQEGITAYGDKTPTYIDIDNIVRIHQTLPDAKLIVIVRDPVRRFQSHYNYTQRSKVKERIREAHAREFQIEHLADPSFDQRILNRGFYADQLEHIFGFYPRNQVHIAYLDEFKEDERGSYNRIFDFLGVERFPIELKRFNEQPTYPFPFTDQATRDLFRLYRSHNTRLFKLLGREQPSWMAYEKL